MEKGQPGGFISNSETTKVPRILYKTIESIINPPPSQQTEAFPLICEQFLFFFTNEINEINLQISHVTGDPSPHCNPSVLLNNSEALSLRTLKRTQLKLKPMLCPLDDMAAIFLKEFLTVLVPLFYLL